MRTSTQPSRTGLHVERVFTSPAVPPYEEVTWQRRDVVMTDRRTGAVTFEQRGVEVPDFWSENATSIVASKYFQGPVGSPGRESSLRQLTDRVVGAYRSAGEAHGYFATAGDAEVFAQELTWMAIHQVFSFNSPVWFNVGTAAPQQVSSCFILAVDDSVDSIFDWYRDEGLIFKNGSGAGVNLSRIRSSREPVSGGGTGSGPVSFMRGADASAGTIVRGGRTRRAAKMVVLDVDHPDVEEFVETKQREERKIRVLRDAGFDMELGGRDITSLQFQNANNAVRVTDEFMRAALAGGRFPLRARLDGSVVDTVDARALLRRIAEAAWECADPGLQYEDTINDWHTNPDTGRITASNPCSEFMSLDNSSCNLASVNLLRFLREDGTFDAGTFVRAVELLITAMDISISFADFPTEAIAATTRAYRQLGIGYANLGALLMATGCGYDSDRGRALAAAVTSLMTATAYRRSAELAGLAGAYAGYRPNAAAHQRVLRKHAAAHAALEPAGPLDAAVSTVAGEQWQRALELGDRHGLRNAQVSALAPTGTIAFMMDCDTTGIEPDFALVKTKKLAGGGSLRVVNRTVPQALRALGYPPAQVERIAAYVAEHGHVVGSPELDPAHHPVFDCAVGVRALSPQAHVRMMAAVQPFLSGAISKTVNIPESATVEDVENLYIAGWRLGLKSLAVYRDNCKVGQPLTAAGRSAERAGPAAAPLPTVDGRAGGAAPPEAKPVAPTAKPVASSAEPPAGRAPGRRRMPKRRQSQTVSFSVAGAEGYLMSSTYPDGALGEMFVKMSKQGSTLAGVMDAFSIAISVGLQYGVPLDVYLAEFVNMRFEPAGPTDDRDVRVASSVIDYLFRRLALDHLPDDDRWRT